MTDYSSFIYNAIAGAGDPIMENRQRAFERKKYSDALIADQAATAYAHQRDAVKDSQWQQGFNLDKQKVAQGYTTDDIKEFQFAKRNGFEGGFKDWMTIKGAGSGGGAYFGTPLPYQNGDEVGYALPSKAGGTTALTVPGGGKWLSPLDKAAMAAEGKATGTAAAALPSTMRSTERLVNSIDDTLNDPALPTITGPIQGRTWNTSGDAARAQSRLDMVRGGAFLNAYNDLRGAGAITEQEGQAAQAAYHRLTTAGQTMNDEDFRQALQEFRDEVVKLQQLAIQKASAGGYRAPGAPGAPAAPQAPGGGWSVQQVP